MGLEWRETVIETHGIGGMVWLDCWSETSRAGVTAANHCGGRL